MHSLSEEDEQVLALADEWAAGATTPQLLHPNNMRAVLEIVARLKTERARLTPSEADGLEAKFRSAEQEISALMAQRNERDDEMRRLRRELQALRERLREYHSDVDGDDIKNNPKYDGVRGIVQWVKDSKAELARTREGIFDAGLRCVSEGGQVFYFDPEELEALLDKLERIKDEIDARPSDAPSLEWWKALYDLLDDNESDSTKATDLWTTTAHDIWGDKATAEHRRLVKHAAFCLEYGVTVEKFAKVNGILILREARLIMEKVAERVKRAPPQVTATKNCVCMHCGVEHNNGEG